jgi:hypothetical protein
MYIFLKNYFCKITIIFIMIISFNTNAYCLAISLDVSEQIIPFRNKYKKQVKSTQKKSHSFFPKQSWRNIKRIGGFLFLTGIGIAFIAASVHSASEFTDNSLIISDEPINPIEVLPQTVDLSQEFSIVPENKSITVESIDISCRDFQIITPSPKEYEIDNELILYPYTGIPGDSSHIITGIYKESLVILIPEKHGYPLFQKQMRKVFPFSVHYNIKVLGEGLEYPNDKRTENVLENYYKITDIIERESYQEVFMGIEEPFLYAVALQNFMSDLIFKYEKIPFSKTIKRKTAITNIIREFIESYEISDEYKKYWKKLYRINEDNRFFQLLDRFVKKGNLKGIEDLDEVLFSLSNWKKVFHMFDEGIIEHAAEYRDLIIGGQLNIFDLMNTGRSKKWKENINAIIKQENPDILIFSCGAGHVEELSRLLGIDKKHDSLKLAPFLERYLRRKEILQKAA